MTVVRIKCTRCLTTSMPELDALLVEVVGVDLEENTGAIVNWVCAGCSSLVSCPIDWSDFLNLVSAGALVVDEEDTRPLHPEFAVDGPAWRPDDLLDLHTLLSSPDWFDKLQGASDTATDLG
jgi:hypothetical protein